MDALLKGVQKNVSLAKYTTFQIGGKARHFYIARTRDRLAGAISAAKRLDLPVFILGGGSNLLISDRGFPGLVVKIQMTGFGVEKDKIYAEAGAMLSDLVRASSEAGLTGLEWAAGIPGTVGGAVRGNAGAFDGSISDLIKEVEVLDFGNTKIKTLKKKDCGFGYRKSVFKKNKNLVVLSALFQLKKGSKREIEREIERLLDYRKSRHPLDFPSAGSVFKNPSEKSAGELIEKSGLRGKRVGNVGVSEKHTNFIVNLGGGKAEDVLKLIALIKKKVKDKFGIELEEEIQLLGF